MIVSILLVGHAWALVKVALLCRCSQDGMQCLCMPH